MTTRSYYKLHMAQVSKGVKQNGGYSLTKCTRQTQYQIIHTHTQIATNPTRPKPSVAPYAFYSGRWKDQTLYEEGRLESNGNKLNMNKCDNSISPRESARYRHSDQWREIGRLSAYGATTIENDNTKENISSSRPARLTTTC